MTDTQPRVLIVEDDPAWRDLSAELLEDAGYTVTQAADLESAMTALDRICFHVAIVDIMLAPGEGNRDGLTVLRKIYEMNEGTHAVILSEHATIDMYDEFRRYGIIDVGRKVRTPAEEARELQDLDFIIRFAAKREMQTRDSRDAFLRTINVRARESLRSEIRRRWTVSPFSCIRGMSPRDILFTLDNGPMSELRPFLGNLYRDTYPWLLPLATPARAVPAGVEFYFWSRARGMSLAARVTMAGSLDASIVEAPVIPVVAAGKLGEPAARASSRHFEGVIYAVEGVPMADHFQTPPLRREAHFAA